MKTIDLSQLKAPVIDLNGSTPEVIITGRYTGKRPVVKGHDGKTVFFLDGQIHETTDDEDSIAFEGGAENCKIFGRNFKFSGGGIQFWGPMIRTQIGGLFIFNAHTGIRCTADHANRDVFIFENSIYNCSHEGIYIGASNEDAIHRSTGCYVYNNTIERTEWDGIQIGNNRYALVFRNKILQAGFIRKSGQDYGITINPNSLAWVWGNIIQETEKHIQAVFAEKFFTHPPTGFTLKKFPSLLQIDFPL